MQRLINATLTAFLFLTPSLLAHDPGLSSARATIHPNEVRVQVAFSNTDIAGLAGDRDGKLSAAEVAASRDDLVSLIRDGVSLRVAEQSLALTHATVGLGENQDICYTLTYGCPQGLSAGTLSWRLDLLTRLARGHRHYVAISDPSGRLLGHALLHRGKPTAMVDNLSAAQTPPPFQQGWNFLVLGIEHILIGYDHILFLLALLVAGGSLRAAIAIITSFTVAHSLTLAVAALDFVRLPSDLVEAVIALSIVWVGIQNLCGSGRAHRWRITFLFGLVHGFGFASVLRDLGFGGDQGVVLPLLAFNVGVEIGQLAIASVALPLLWWLASRRVGPMITLSASIAITLVGAWWLLERSVL